MRMTVSVNNESGIPYTQYGTDRQKAKAAKFVNANSNEITELAAKINKREHREQDKKFAKNILRGYVALPLIVGLASAIKTKGKVSTKTLAAAKSAVKVGGAMALIGGILNVNKKVVSNKPKVANAEKKHPILTLAGLSAVAAGVITGAKELVKPISLKAADKLTKVAKKVKLDVVAQKMDKAPETIKSLVSKVTDKIYLPKGVKENIGKISKNIKIPQILKDGYNGAAKMAKKAGNTFLKYPVGATIVALSTIAAGHAIKRTIETSQTRANLKEAQLKTANSLINAYAAENESLKTANAKAAEAVDKSNNIIEEDLSSEAENDD